MPYKFTERDLMKRRYVYAVYDTKYDDSVVVIGTIQEVCMCMGCKRNIVFKHAKRGGLLKRRYRIEPIDKEINFESEENE